MNKSFSNNLCDFLDKTSEKIGQGIAWLTLFMVITQFSVVVLRYLFNIGWISMQESILYMHALVFMLGAAYTLKHDGHVRVDIFYHKMGARGKALVNVLGSLLLLLPVCVFIISYSWDYVANSWSLQEGSREAGGLAGLFLLKSSIVLLPVLLILQGASQFIKNLLTLFNQHKADEHV